MGNAAATSTVEPVAVHASASTLSPTATSTVRSATATSTLELVELPAYPLIHDDQWVVTDEDPHYHVVEKF